jgi:hypothetical protein
LTPVFFFFGDAILYNKRELNSMGSITDNKKIMSRFTSSAGQPVPGSLNRQPKRLRVNLKQPGTKHTPIINQQSKQHHELGYHRSSRPEQHTLKSVNLRPEQYVLNQSLNLKPEQHWGID